jgi:TatD DNase family protein
VRELSRQFPFIIPSFGLHPWYVSSRSATWEKSFRQQLDEGGAAVGEIGLDRWIEGYDLPAQEMAFHFQMNLAAERNLPVSIHCLKAWGRLHELLRDGPRPARGFLLHSYGGPEEMIDPLVKLGAYFSVSGHFAHPRKERQREAFRTLPKDRLLIETDAPDMLPPEPWVSHRLPDVAVNHPGNLRNIYTFAAELRGQELEPFAEQMEQNFRRLFFLNHVPHSNDQ